MLREIIERIADPGEIKLKHEYYGIEELENGLKSRITTEHPTPEIKTPQPAAKPLAHKDFIASGKDEAEWDIYAKEQNLLSKERNTEKVIQLWRSEEGVGGSDIVNLLRSKDVAVPEEMKRLLQNTDTVVSSTSVAARGLKKGEASAVHKWVSEQMNKEFPPTTKLVPIIVAPKPKLISERVIEEEKPQEAGTACVPCSMSHVATCAGELNEAVRFARKDIKDPEVSLRIDHCLSEIAACERIDLSPENVAKLPESQKPLAHDIANEIREIRHGLEWFKSADELENLAAKTNELQHRVGRAWLNERLGGS